MLYKFKTPYEFEGKKYEELEADLTQLKGRDLADAKRAYTKAGNFAVLPVTDADYCVEIISRLTKLPREFFDDMPARDYLAITTEVSNFLMASD